MLNDLLQSIDLDRWLLNNGLISDKAKNELFACGSIVHKEVRAIDLRVMADKKLVEYDIYVPNTVLKKRDKYFKFYGSKRVLDMWRFKRLLLKEGCLDFQQILNAHVKNYCGPSWSTKVSVLSIDKYVDTIETQDEDPRSPEADQSAHVG
jgi:hypothetical protein